MFYPLLTIAFGVIALYVARRGYATINETAAWPTVPGRVLERGLGAAMGSLTYKARAKYSYTVAGVEYQNDQVYPIPGTGQLATRVRQIVDAIPDAVDVHYDPMNPSRSYLLPQPASTLHIATVFGGVVTTVGVLMLLVALLE